MASRHMTIVCPDNNSTETFIIHCKTVSDASETNNCRGIPKKVLHHQNRRQLPNIGFMTKDDRDPGPELGKC